jgi:hypothetical protein
MTYARWFVSMVCEIFVEGKVLSELSGLSSLLNDEPAIITRRKPMEEGRGIRLDSIGCWRGQCHGPTKALGWKGW